MRGRTRRCVEGEEDGVNQGERDVGLQARSSLIKLSHVKSGCKRDMKDQ